MSAQIDGGARRQIHAGEARSKRYVVKVTPTDETRLEAAAGERQITVARLLVESALAPLGDPESGPALTETDRRDLLTAILALRQLASSSANNVNQIAKYANENRLFPVEAAEALMVTRELLLRIDEFLDRFHPQSELARRRRGRDVAVERVDRQWADLLGHQKREEEG